MDFTPEVITAQPAATTKAVNLNGNHAPKKQVLGSHVNGQADFVPFTEDEVRQICRCADTKCKCHTAKGLVHCPAHNDPNPSLNVSEANGKMLWHCHAKCAQGDVTAALIARRGNRPAQIYPATHKTRAAKEPPVKTTSYSYHNADANLLYQVQRREYASGGKDFIQRRPDGHGKWVYDMKGVTPVLYGLPAIVTAETVFLCEGEKDADALNAALELSGHYWNIVATTSHGGAGKFLEAHAAQLEGKSVGILPDNDKPGEHHAKNAATLIERHAKRVCIVRLPNLPDKGGAADYFAAGGTVEDLLALYQVAPNWTPTGTKDDESPEIAPAFKFSTDLALDERLGDVKWLWPGYIPAGFVTALVGDQDMGKSSVAQGLCDVILRGTAWPDGQPHTPDPTTRLIWIDTEGAIALFRGRLKDWGMPRGRFILPEDSIQELRIDDPASWLWIEEAIRRFNPPLVVIDALSGAHSRGENKSDDMKVIMKSLGEMAQRHQTAIVVIHHLSKPAPGILEFPITIHRMRGSSAISQFCRSVIALGLPDPSQPERRRMDIIKLNLAPKPEPVGYLLSDVGPLWGDAPEQPKAHRSIDDAKDFLTQMFDEIGILSSDDIWAEAKAKGISDRSVKDAKKALGIKAVREGGQDGRWFWEMPNFGK